MHIWNGKEPRLMSANPSAPDSGPPLHEDPVASSVHMWGLRLWVVCAILIVAFALLNYFLNWLTK